MRSGRRRFRQLRGGLLVPCAGAKYTAFLLVGLEWTSAGGLGHGLGPDLLFLEGRTEEGSKSRLSSRDGFDDGEGTVILEST